MAETVIDPIELERRMQAIRLPKVVLADRAGRNLSALDDFLTGRKETRLSTRRDFEGALEQIERETLKHLLSLYSPGERGPGGESPETDGIEVASGLALPSVSGSFAERAA